MQITDRDEEILIALSLKVRFFSLTQLSRTWWPQSLSAAKNRLLTLKRHGLIHFLEVHAHPELAQDKPLFSWSPGEPKPNYGALAWQAQKRWTDPLILTPIVIASKATARRYGGFGGSLKKPSQTTHDLHVASVYLIKLREQPEQAAAWVSEDYFAPERRHQKLPDAVIRDAFGQVSLVIEYAGAYDKKHIERVHQDSLERNLPYELW